MPRKKRAPRATMDRKKEMLEENFADLKEDDSIDFEEVFDLKYSNSSQPDDDDGRDISYDEIFGLGRCYDPRAPGTGDSPFIDVVKIEPNDEMRAVSQLPIESNENDPLGPFHSEMIIKDEPTVETAGTEDQAGTSTLTFRADPGQSEATNAKGANFYDDVKEEYSRIEKIVSVPLKLKALGRLLEIMDLWHGAEPRVKDQPGSATTSNKPDTDDEASVVGPSSIVQLLADGKLVMGSRSKTQENTIIRIGRATPLMGNSSKRGVLEKSQFWANADDYQQVPWLTGSEKLQKYFCFPCLLYTKERWSLQAGGSMEYFFDAVNEHCSDLLHRVAYHRLALRQSELEQSKNSVIDPADITKMNRNLLTALLRILCAKTTLLSHRSLNACAKCMHEEISSRREFHLNGKKPSKDSLEDFVARHADRLLPSIKAKLSKCVQDFLDIPFASIIYEDTKAVVDSETQVAVILRFVTGEGDIRERFWKFVEMRESRKSYDFLEIHLSLIEELGNRMRVVGYTFSGTVVEPADMEELVENVTRCAPGANFFHHPDHDLKELLLQSLSHVEECRGFLKVISDLVKFLAVNPGASSTLATFIECNQPNCHLDRGRCCTIDILSTIRRHYPLVMRFFSEVSSQPMNDKVTDAAKIFEAFLQEPYNKFLIVVIATVLDDVDDLSKAMAKGYDPFVWKNLSTRALEALKQLREIGPVHFEFLGSSDNMQPCEDPVMDVEMPHCPDTFARIIDNAWYCINQRAGKAESFYMSSRYWTTYEFLQSIEIWRCFDFRCGSPEDLRNYLRFFKGCITPFARNSFPKALKAAAVIPRDSAQLEMWWLFLRFASLVVPPYQSLPTAVLELKSYLKSKVEINLSEAVMYLERDLLQFQLLDPYFINEIIDHYAKNNLQLNFMPNLCQFSDIEIAFE